MRKILLGIVLFLMFGVFGGQVNAGVSPDINATYADGTSIYMGLVSGTGANSKYYRVDFISKPKQPWNNQDNYHDTSVRIGGMGGHIEYFNDIDSNYILNGGVIHPDECSVLPDWFELRFDENTQKWSMITSHDPLPEICITERNNGNFSQGIFMIQSAFPMTVKVSTFSGNASVSQPTHLRQETQSPSMEKQEISVGEKIGKYQSGSGIILSAKMNDSFFDWTTKELEVEVYKVGDTTPVYRSSSSDGELIVPFDGIGVGEYYWKARIKDNEGNVSSWEEFGNNTSNDADFTFYKGFEPYPYGYKFYNRIVADGVLNGKGLSSIVRGVPPFYSVIVNTPTIIDGNKWILFRNAFDTSVFQNDERKMIDAFESLGLNTDKQFEGGSCYGMAVSSSLQSNYPSFMELNYNNFSHKVGSGTIWHNIEDLSVDEDNRWNQYEAILETILSFQLSQSSTHVQKAIYYGKKSAQDIVTELKNHPQNTYVLLFFGKDKDNKDVGHAVIPYKVQETSSGSQIYVWDNNVPYPNLGKNRISYNQFIEIKKNGTWENKLYNRNSFTEMSLVNLEDIYNNGDKSAPLGFAGTDTSFTLSGSSNIYISDALGRRSGFIEGNVVKEIPGVHVIVPVNALLEGETPKNTLKQIYLPEKIEGLTLKITGTEEEKYDLMIAGGDYYNKLKGVNTSSGQIDTFEISRENITIDFDDTKTGTYSILVDDFQNNGTGTVFIDSMKVNTNLQQYTIDWEKVVNKSNESIIYELDTNNDTIFDTTLKSSPLISGEIFTPKKYIFPSQTIAYNSGQQKVISSYRTIVGNYEGFRWGEDIPFTTGGQGNPTVQTSNGTRAGSGNLRGGFNISMDVPPSGETYTSYVDIPGVRLEFTTTKNPLPPLEVGTLDFGTKVVKYSGNIVSNRVNFPFVPEETEFILHGDGNPTAQTSNGTRNNTGTVKYGTNIQVEIPPVGQTRVVEFTINGKVGKFTVIRK